MAEIAEAKGDVRELSDSRLLKELAVGLCMAMDSAATRGLVDLDDLATALTQQQEALREDLLPWFIRERRLQKLADLDRRRGTFPSDAVVVSERRYEAVGLGRIEQPIHYEWNVFTEDGEPASLSGDIVIGVRTPAYASWEANVGGEYKDGPVPLDNWLWDRLRDLDTAVSSQLSKSFADALSTVKMRVEEGVERAEKRVDAVELRLSVVAALRDELVRSGSTLASQAELTAFGEGIELTESDEPRVARRRIINLTSERVYVAVEAAELIREGRAGGWAEAHRLLLKEVQAWNPTLELAYKTEKLLRDDMSQTRRYGVSVEEARRDGKNAFPKQFRSEYEALA